MVGPDAEILFKSVNRYFFFKLLSSTPRSYLVIKFKARGNNLQKFDFVDYMIVN